jgi:hypothetical protein
MLTLEFELRDGSLIYGFIPCDRQSADTDQLLIGGLDQANTLASFADLQQERGVFPGMKRAAFIFLDDRWNLAWWTDGTAVYRMHWFDRHLPDPAGYLGRPLMGGDAPGEARDDEGGAA